MMTTTTLLVDGDHALYVACAAVEHEIRWDDQNHVLYSNLEEALAAFDHTIAGKLAAFDHGEVWFAFSGPDNFRKTVSQTYKCKRTSRKPMCYFEALDEIFRRYKCAKVNTLEGDDLLGIWHTRDDADTIIVSEDKDMKTLPGKLYRQGKLETISQEEADYNWMMQTLTGDSTDNYPGLSGCGPVKAARILGSNTKLPDLWDAVVGAYKSQDLDETDALIQARLARILRNCDWDSERKEVILWQP